VVAVCCVVPAIKEYLPLPGWSVPTGEFYRVWGVLAGDWRMGSKLVWVGEDGALGGEELVDALFGEVEHLTELGAGVGVVLGGGLGFD
jgi:hypothetical protein